MNLSRRPQPFASTARVDVRTGAVEWEELPSLAASLRQRMHANGNRADFEESSSFGASVWDNTRPAPLDSGFEPEPFRETIRGLATREVHEPDVFRHFFA